MQQSYVADNLCQILLPFAAKYFRNYQTTSWMQLNGKVLTLHGQHMSTLTIPSPCPQSIPTSKDSTTSLGSCSRDPKPLRDASVTMRHPKLGRRWSKEMQRTDQSLLSFLQHLATKALVNCHQARWHRGIATLCSHIHILPTCNKTLSLLQLSYIHLALQGEFMFKDCTYILYDSLITLIRREW